MGEFSTIVQQRRSIRQYLPDPVPESVIREIISEACWAPSWGNTQSTSLYILSGDVLAQLKAGLLDRALQGTPGNPDVEMPAPGSWPEPYRSRTMAFIESRAAYVAEEETRLGVKRTEPPLPPPVAGASLFGAPHLLLLCTTKGVSAPYWCFDAGLFAQTLALAAQNRGLGTCLMAGVVLHPDLFRALIPDSDDLVFVAGMTLGYPDLSAPVNNFPRERVPADQRTVFLGS